MPGLNLLTDTLLPEGEKDTEQTGAAGTEAVAEGAGVAVRVGAGVLGIWVGTGDEAGCGVGVASPTKTQLPGVRGGTDAEGSQTHIRFWSSMKVLPFSTLKTPAVSRQ